MKVLKKMASEAEEEAFEMKCKFEMKREDPRRKNQDCERMIGTECKKKGRNRAALNRETSAIACRWERIAGK